MTTEKRVSVMGEFFKVLYFLPALCVAVWIGYLLLVARLSWDFSGKLMKEFTGD